MQYTLFFSRLRDLGSEERGDYQDRSTSLYDLAVREHPGFVDLKTFVADDGERLTVARFTDAEAQKAWRRDTRHREAQRLGREVFYEEYRITVCEEIRSHAWSRDEETPKGGTA